MGGIKLSSIPDAIFYKPIAVEPSTKNKGKYAIRFKVRPEGAGNMTTLHSVLIDIDDINSNKVHLYKCSTPILMDKSNKTEYEGEE